MKRLLEIAIVVSVAPLASAQTAPPSQSPHPAVVRVIAPDRGGTSCGSGALVAVHQAHGLVVTNWHVVRDATGPIVVVFPDGFRSSATVLRTDRDWDLAALAIRRPNVRPIPLAGAAPRPGEMLTIAGYGRGRYRAAAGRCIQYVSPGFNRPFEMVELAAQARQGDSGGPILNQRGELAGVLFGAALGRTTGSYCGRVRGFLAGILAENGDQPFRQLPPERTMIADRPPRKPAPVAAIGRSSSAVPPARASEDQPRRRELVDLPPRPPRPLPQPSEAPTVSVPAAGKQPVASLPAAGPSRIEQAKTILAAIGIFAIFFHGLRLLAAPQKS